MARSWLLERSLEDLRLLALGRGLLVWSSAASGDADLELPFLEWEPEPERGLPCSLAGACFPPAFFLLRELDVEREREREQGGDRSSTTRWVVVGGMSGSPTVTQVTIRSSEPKKVLRGGRSSSSQGSCGDGLCAQVAGPRPSRGPSSPSLSGGPSPWILSMLEEGPLGGSGSVPVQASTV